MRLLHLHQLKNIPATIQPSEKRGAEPHLSSSCPYRSLYYSPLDQSCSQKQRPIIQKSPKPAVHFPHNKLGNNLKVQPCVAKDADLRKFFANQPVQWQQCIAGSAVLCSRGSRV